MGVIQLGVFQCSKVVLLKGVLQQVDVAVRRCCSKERFSKGLLQ